MATKLPNVMYMARETQHILLACSFFFLLHSETQGVFPPRLGSVAI